MVELAISRLGAVFSQITDPRDARGVRHPYSSIVALVFLGLLSRITEMAVLVRAGFQTRAFEERDEMELTGIFEDQRRVAELSAGPSLSFAGAEAGLASEMGAHGEMRLDLFRYFGVHARAPEQSAPDAFHTNLRTRVTPLETLSQLDSASSKR